MQEYPLADRIPIGIFMIRGDFCVEFWNSCIEDWTGIERESVLGGDIRDIFPRLRESRYQSRLNKLFEDGLPVILSYQLNGDIFSARSVNHPERIHHSTITAIKQENGFHALFAIEDMTEVANRIKSARDEIDMRGKVEKELRTALTEKQMLMNELNHRVKNNLNMIRSLISLQEGSLIEARSKTMYQDLEARIGSIALLHEMLYKTNLAEGMHLDQYLDSLCRSIFSAFLPKDTQVVLDIELEHACVSTDTTLALGLIVSEIFTNAIKYGIDGRKTGTISVRLFSRVDGPCLEIADDGPGFPPDFDIAKTESLGMKLVYMMTTQIGGNLAISFEKGTRVSLSIPVNNDT